MNIGPLIDLSRPVGTAPVAVAGQTGTASVATLLAPVAPAAPLLPFSTWLNGGMSVLRDDAAALLPDVADEEPAADTEAEAEPADAALPSAMQPDTLASLLMTLIPTMAPALAAATPLPPLPSLTTGEATRAPAISATSSPNAEAAARDGMSPTPFAEVQSRMPGGPATVDSPNVPGPKQEAVAQIPAGLSRTLPGLDGSRVVADPTGPVPAPAAAAMPMAPVSAAAIPVAPTETALAAPAPKSALVGFAAAVALPPLPATPTPSADPGVGARAPVARRSDDRRGPAPAGVPQQAATLRTTPNTETPANVNMLPARSAADASALPVRGEARTEPLPGELATRAPDAAGVTTSAPTPAVGSDDTAVRLNPARPATWQQPLMQALGERVQVQLTQKSEMATIRLDPPMMGSIEVVVRHEAGAIHVQLSASHPDVQRQLQALSESLRHELSQRQPSEVAVLAPQVAADADGRQRQRQHAAESEAEIGRALGEADGKAASAAFTLSPFRTEA